MLKQWRVKGLLVCLQIVKLLKEVVGSIGKLVAPENSDDLAKGIVEVLNKSEQKLQQLGKQGRQRMLNRYSLGYVVEQYINLAIIRSKV